VLLVGLACGGAQPVRMTVADNGHNVELTAGQVLEVSLESNRSTGYSWTRTDESAVLQTAGEAKYTPAGAAEGDGQAAPPGSPGTETWRFLAASPGQATLRLAYRRPFEKEAPPAREYTLNVTVK
jgi:inhibitor of cysteine peptidase